jgi:hypothetical protein
VNELLNWLFGLGPIGFGTSGVELGWARPIPGWAWLLAFIAAGGLGWWSYWRLEGSRRARLALAGARAAVLLLILALISGPELVRPNDRIEKDWLIVLIDRSASMAIPDVNDPRAGSITREQQLARALGSAGPTFAELSENRTVLWLGFDSGVFDLRVQQEGSEGPRFDLGEPVGRRTSIGAALDQAMARAAARPVSGVVMFSDGRSIDEPSRQTLRRLQSELVPVIAVPLGSPDPVGDLAIERAEAPSMAFINDIIPVGVDIDRLGAGGAAGGRVQLIDKSTAQVLDERQLPSDPDAWQNQRTRITLTARERDAGRRTWTVRLIPDGPDLISENNAADLSLELVDRPLRVVYFDGYPRWERHYITSLLVREESIESSSLMLASNRRYLQEGDVLLETLPRSPEEWASIDVIIMGDLPPTVFSHQQLEQIRDVVSIRGVGLLWIGGPGATPSAWRETPLADLLPFSLSGGEAGAGVRAWNEPVLMFPSPTAQRLNLLDLADEPEEGWPAKLINPRTGWSQLYFAQRIDAASLKPTAEILATFAPVSEVPTTPPHAPAASAQASPAVLSMRYGAGRVLYVATDEIWRWRYARGEALTERFWLPLIRLQGRESLARGSRPATLEIAPRRAQVEQPVRIAVSLLDQALAESGPSTLTVRVRPADAPAAAQGMQLTLAPEAAPGGRTRAVRTYATTWIPTEPGKYRVEVIDALLASAGLTAEAEVALPDDELRRPETDHPLLARLADLTGGRVLPADRLSELADPAVLKRRQFQVAGTPDIETLWDKPIILILILTLLTAEWVGRRLMKLP